MKTLNSHFSYKHTHKHKIKKSKTLIITKQLTQLQNTLMHAEIKTNTMRTMALDTYKLYNMLTDIRNQSIND